MNRSWPFPHARHCPRAKKSILRHAPWLTASVDIDADSLHIREGLTGPIRRANSRSCESDVGKAGLVGRTMVRDQKFEVLKLRPRNIELHVALFHTSYLSRLRFTNDEDLARWAAGGAEAAIQTELALAYFSGPPLAQGWLCACQKLEPQPEADRWQTWCRARPRW
jgi:hypothetical protein